MLNILTWHIHGSYLYYLSHVPHRFYLPVKASRTDGYFGRTPSYQWPSNVVEVPATDVASLDLDCVLFQSRANYEKDQYEILSESQRALPRIYLEHDPPRENPTDTKHPVQDPDVLLVQVTHFNDLMWDAGPTPTKVIEHGVKVPAGVTYRGSLDRGVTVVNNIKKRGRRLGHDIFNRVRREIDIDLVGMGWDEAGGLREVPHAELFEFMSEYRFFFNPIRYTSLGLAICEAMMVGLPIVALATTEMVTVVENGRSGIIDTNVVRLIDGMKQLLADPALARELGDGAKQVALERFSIDRFVSDWSQTFESVAGRSRLRKSVLA